jgi:hypothetical protein
MLKKLRTTPFIRSRASGYPPDPMSFRCCVGTSHRLRPPRVIARRTCPPALWRELSGIKPWGRAGYADRFQGRREGNRLAT